MQIVSERINLGKKTRITKVAQCLEDARTIYEGMVREAYCTMNNMRSKANLYDVFIINVRQHEFRCRHKNGAKVCSFHIFLSEDEKSS